MKANPSATIFIAVTLATTFVGLLALGYNPLGVLAVTCFAGLSILGWLWLFSKYLGPPR